jgi:hypothetical protein
MLRLRAQNDTPSPCQITKTQHLEKTAFTQVPSTRLSSTSKIFHSPVLEKFITFIKFIKFINFKRFAAFERVAMVVWRLGRPFL